jgi:hypothetical protein
VSEFKVDKSQLNQPVSKEESTVARGSFGMVFRRTLHTQVCGSAKNGHLELLGTLKSVQIRINPHAKTVYKVTGLSCNKDDILPAGPQQLGVR